MSKFKKKEEIIFILNSDFGVRNTIGARALPIANEVSKNNNLTILCRGYNKDLKKEFNIVQCFPYADFIMKVFTAIPIYISKNFPAGRVKNDIFEYFTVRKLNKLKNISIIHSWDYLPNIYNHVKSKNKNMVVIQDATMALPNILTNKELFDLVGKDKLETPKYVKNSLKYIDYYVVPSDFVKKSLINEGINENKIFVVPFGVDINKFKPNEKDYNESFKVAFSGNVNSRKGIRYLVQAWKELDLNDAELNIYGRVYPEVKKYLKDAEKYNIRLHGFVNNLHEELLKNHVYAFPSLLEGSAKSIYEALACGLPVITTANSGSIVENGLDGFIIPTQDVEALKEKILFFYNNRNKIEEFGKRARKKAEQHTWENYGKRVNEIYKLVNGDD
uniref:glycosyltransferase family 4 protein n=1 Tax=Methanothermococcus thermolithotrophicus TaxID=2186 RepID=UPI0004757DC2|nr:glycosyltransferase family 4 protein [Methanothermococcus thermolithotrophicus]